ncbi:ABC transporter ATP-binding protein, partial [Candidatus Microgenomates bacterium]|nr:ABC transporter ATP-binding protein [Candidatus Microgenomates bacterium]
MFSLQSVSKSFGAKEALRGVNLEVKTGEIIGFLGPNGAGKTSTMRILLGYLQPTSGTVTVFKKNPVLDRLEVLSSVGYLPENNPLYPDMKVHEYLSYIAEIKGVTDWVAKSSMVGLEDVLDTKIEALSRGFRQRVGLAAALLGDPKMLILDEPTSGLDPLEQERIKSLIKKIANTEGRNKRTVIFSTHVLSEVESIATRLVIIHEGAIVYDGKKPAGHGSV